MVLSDVNGGNGKKSAAERWLIQRNGQRVSAARCIFGPPEKRAHLMVLMRNEVEMDRKRAEFVARYEPVGLTPNERRKFYDGLVNTSSSPVPQNRQQQQQHRHQNNGKSSIVFLRRSPRTVLLNGRVVDTVPVIMLVLF